MILLTLMRATARRDDPRYPRRGNVRLLRMSLLLVWLVIGFYASAVWTNLRSLLGQKLSHLIDRNALLGFLSGPKTPRYVLILPILAFALLLAGSLWAVRDRALERAVRQLRSQPTRPSPTSLPPDFDMPSLYIFSIEGDPSPCRVPLINDEESIGRDTSNTIVLRDPRVSRQQMRIVKEMDCWRVICSPNSAPLYVNGSAQTNTLLRPYDQLVVGLTALIFTAHTPPTVTARVDNAPRLIVNTRSVNFAVALRDPQIRLGRAPTCGIVVPSSIVSLAQAELLRTSALAYEIRKLEAMNDLQFESHPVSTHMFRDGDLLTIGAGSDVEIVKLQYQAPEPSQPIEIKIALGKGGLVDQILDVNGGT